jgi:hypothetical protein
VAGRSTRSLGVTSRAMKRATICGIVFEVPLRMRSSTAFIETAFRRLDSRCHSFVAVTAVALLAVACASPEKPRFRPSCKANFEYVYDLHVKAMSSAKAGNCAVAIEQFESTIREWRHLADSENCDSEYKNLAKDGYSRAQFDLGVARSKYCRDP